MSVGSNISRIRRENGLTIKELSLSSGVALSLISQIEHDKANPSLSTLTGLAQAMNVSLSQFFEEETHKNDDLIIRRMERPLKVKSEGCFHYLLTNRDFEGLRFTYIIYDNSYRPKAVLEPHDNKYEFAFVIFGQIKVEIENQEYILYQGDSICYEANRPHRVSNADPARSEVLWVLMN